MPDLIRRFIVCIAIFYICYLCSSFAYAKSESFFGLDTTPRSFRQDLNDADELGIGIMRIVVWWQHLEPAPDEFTWEKLDEVVDNAKKADIDLLLQIMSTSGWGAKEQSQQRGSYHSSSMPKDITQWNNFMEMLASRYKGRRVYYEIGNEVNASAFWSGTIEEYAELLKVSYQTIKKVDPDAVVLPSAVACGITKGVAKKRATPGALKKHDDYLRVIFATHAFDAVNIHDYYFPSEIIVNNFSFQSYLKHIHDLMKEGQVGNKPVWITEAGYPSQPVNAAGSKFGKLSPDTQAEWLKEAYTQARDFGVKKIFWLLMRDRKEPYFGTMGLIDSNGKKRPAWQAMKNLIENSVEETQKSKWSNNQILIKNLPEKPYAQEENAKPNIRYFGAANHSASNAKDAANFVNYIKELKGFSNVITLPFVFEGNNLLSPAEEHLRLAADYEMVVLPFGRKTWKENRDTRQILYKKLKERPGFENVDIIVVVDEPYLWGKTPRELEAMILEVKDAFPNKHLAVNFNRRGFYPQNQGPDAPIPDKHLHYVSFDLYPCNFGKGCNDESGWKNVIQETIDFLRQKTNKPIIYIAQGFSKRECPLTAENVEWSYEVADENNLEAILYWFPEDKAFKGLGPGFTHPANKEAEEKIEELGRMVIGRRSTSESEKMGHPKSRKKERTPKQKPRRFLRRCLF